VTVWAVIQALLKALPQLLRLFQSIADHILVAEARGMGRAEAAAEALTIADSEVRAATSARAEAAADHAAKADDTALDDDFRRP